MTSEESDGHDGAPSGEVASTGTAREGATALVEVRRRPEQRAIAFTWDDGWSAALTWRHLAGHCPCAGCQGHGGGVEFQEPPRDIEPESIQPVGNYAISIVWRRGCRTGIFTFPYLRELANKPEPPDPALLAEPPS